MRLNPRVYFSFRSPFSWMAIERLQQVVPDAYEVLEFIPYWEPDSTTERALQQQGAVIQYAPMSKAKHLYILQDTKRLAESLGLHMAWPVDVNPVWEVPHLGWLAAQRLGYGKAFYCAVVTARWTRGENICDVDVICRLAESIGASGEAIAGASSDPEIRAWGVGCLARAYEDDIFGVPYFLSGRQRFWGFDRLDAFLKVLQAPPDNSQQAGAGDPLDGVPALVRSSLGAYDRDSAGACG